MEVVCDVKHERRFLKHSRHTHTVTYTTKESQKKIPSWSAVFTFYRLLTRVAHQVDNVVTYRCCKVIEGTPERVASYVRPRKQ